MWTARGQLGLIALVQVLVMALWFSASAAVPALREDWGISSTAAGWLTISVQLGFVLGAVLAALLSLADRIPAPALIAGSALLGSAANAAVVISTGMVAALPLRFVTGMALAGVYPVGMKLMTTWFRQGRSLALGILVAALTLGSSMPHLVGAFAGLAWEPLLLISSGCGLVGAAVAGLSLRTGPFAGPSAPLAPGYLLSMFRDPHTRLVNLGYFGHMWELYALWAWLPAFTAASLTAWRVGSSTPIVIGLIAFTSIGVAGGVGCLIGGRLGDRYGAGTVAMTAMLVSGVCCLLSVPLFGTHPALVVALLTIWGAAVIADSAQFSAVLSELVDPRYVGTALTAQTAIGFALTIVTIQGLPILADLVGWRWSMAALAIGPLGGAIAMARLARHRQTAGNGFGSSSSQ